MFKLKMSVNFTTTIKQSTKYAIVKSFEWGMVTVRLNNRDRVYKDVILTNSFATEWDWKKFGLHHSPGYDEDVMSKIMKYVELIGDVHIILSTGVDQAINVNVDLEDYPKTTFLQSAVAIDVYHQLINEGENVILFLHSTC